MNRRQSALRVLDLRDADAGDGLPRGFSIPRGLRRVGAHAYLDGRRVYRDDLLELDGGDGKRVRGRYWPGDGARWDCLICSERWMAYIIGPSSTLRWPSDS